MDTLIQCLEQIQDDMDAINPGDSDGWKKITEKLLNVMGRIPEGFEILNPLWELLIEGVSRIQTRTTSDVFALFTAVTQGIETTKTVLLKPDTPPDKIQSARQCLMHLLEPSDTILSPSETVNSVEEKITLHDLAARLMQQNMDDSNELSEFYHILENFAQTDVQNESAAERIRHAASLVNQLILNGPTDADSVFQEIGEDIEQAIQMSENLYDETRMASAPPSGAPNSADPSPLPAAITNYMPENPDTELIGEFITEGSELISHAEEALLTLEVDPEDVNAVGTVFRAFHTIKGTSAFLELNLLADMGHHAETLLSRVRDHEIRYSGGYADLALRSLDMLKSLMQAMENALSGAPLLKPEGYDDLMDILKNPEEAGVSDSMEAVTPPRIGDILVARGKSDRSTVEQAIRQHPDDPIGVALVKENAASITEVGQALRTQGRITGAKQFVESSVRVSTDRLDRLIDMVGELVIAHSMVAQDGVVINSNHYELLKKVNHTSKIVRALQDLCMSMRMIPLRGTFQKMTRLVRDVSRKVGKTVTFVTEGDDTEIDRNLVDVINDPLVHMVRNAVDHGVESPAERAALGKPSHGTVKLSAYHAAGNVVVEISDDGKGLDRNAILAKAREKGMVSENITPSDRDIYNLVLEPGFSTAKVVTDVSGRGVGMDVVKKNIESLRGQVEILSEPGKGSIFRMKLPLTLAIIDGMVVKAGIETYVIPTASIVRSIKPDSQDISTVLNQGSVLRLQGSLIPLFRLTSLYQIAYDEQSHSDLIVVIEDEGARVGLVIDELVGRQQVVIKSLGESMQHIPGISGGAIMPDGRVGLILDIGGLMKFAISEQDAGRDDKYRKDSA